MDNSFDSLLNASAVPQDEKVQAFIAESRNNRNRCYELSEQVTAQVATDGKMLQKYLDVQSTFDRYTTNNALLILAQRPDAQKLGDYGYWRDHGFYLKRMERQNPVLILEPGKTYKREDGTVGNYYNAKKLYDISQTTMSDTTIQKSEYEEHDLIRALVSTPPVNIVAAEPEQMPDEKGAFFKPEEGCIYVRKGMSAQEIFQNLVPELVFAGYADGNPHRKHSEGCRSLGHTNTKCHRQSHDRGITITHRLTCDQLDTCHCDRCKHRNSRSTKDTLRNCCQQRGKLRHQTGNQQNTCRHSQNRTVDNLCSCNNTNVLAVCCCGKSAEQCAYNVRKTITNDSTLQFIILRCSVHSSDRSR